MLIAANAIFSWRGFGSRIFYERYMFHVEKILRGGEYVRIVTSGFLHANFGHLLFNMIALYSFSVGIGMRFGFKEYILIYFGSLVAGNLLALYIQKDNPDYRAVGASGAVCGVIYSSILIFPDSSISILFLPFAIPSWLFGILFIILSVYGIKTRFGNIGHEAHLGGAMSGVVISVLLKPGLLFMHPWLVTALLGLTGGFLLVMVKRPDLLKMDDRWKVKPRAVRFSSGRKGEGISSRGGARGARLSENERDGVRGGGSETDRQELDRLLDKINRVGIENLSRKEKARLYTLSARFNDK